MGSAGQTQKVKSTASTTRLGKSHFLRKTFLNAERSTTGEHFPEETHPVLGQQLHKPLLPVIKDTLSPTTGQAA